MNRRRPTALLALGAIVLASFLWGYLAHRNKIFPYPLGKELAMLAGIIPRPSQPTPEIGTPVEGAVDALTSLAYVSGTVDPNADQSGVVVHDREHTAPGWNLFSPRLRPQAFLVDMDGEVGHSWRADTGAWQHTELLPGGQLLATVKDELLMRLDADSRILWTYRDRVHHDLDLDSEDRIHVLTRRLEDRPEIHPELPVLVDRVTTVSLDGEVLADLSLLDLVLESPYAFLLPDVRQRPVASMIENVDILHTNHVEVFDGALAERSPIYAAGNLLLSMRTISTIFIVDPTARQILWAWGPSNVVFQHHPTLLDDGNILLFNNGHEHSEVVEIDPLENRIVWTWRADDFFSRTRGGAQRLANGNTLVTESDTGYVFEVTPEGERVWVYAIPFFPEEEKRSALWRMTRYDPDDPRLPPDLR